MHLANAGYCNICGTQTRFVAATAWLRDDYQCVRCKTIPRQRALLHILNLMRPNWRSLVLHESSPSIRYYAEQARSYTCSFFFDDVPPGGHDEEGRLCQNLEALVFPDGVFDVFITQDVLEHVFSQTGRWRKLCGCLNRVDCTYSQPPSIRIFSAAILALSWSMEPYSICRNRPTIRTR